MIICTQQKRASILEDKLSLSVNGVFLENVTSHKILGVLIDNNLSWKQHIEHLCVEVSKLIGLLWRNKHLLPYSSRVLFYNSYIQPCIDYCLPIWGKASAIHLDKIWRLKNEQLEQFSMFLMTLQHKIYSNSLAG